VIATGNHSRMAITREQLYQEVWAEPMTRVAARHGVSSSFLARVCTRLNIPRPRRGYWAKLAVGRVSEREALPQAALGDELEWSRGETSVLRSQAMPTLPGAPRVRKRVRLEREGLHPLLIEAKPHLEGAQLTEVGYLRPAKRNLVDIFVSAEALQRTLETSSRLFDALEARGYRVCLPAGGAYHGRPSVDPRDKPDKRTYWHYCWRPGRGTIVFLGTLAVGLTVYELSERVQVVRQDGRYVRATDPTISQARRRRADLWVHEEDLPSGRLCVRAYCPYGYVTWSKEWREAKPGDLAHRAKRIASELAREAPTLLRLIEEGKRKADLDYQEREEQWRRWQEEEAETKRLKAIDESRADLLAIVATWASANRIERFFRDAARRAEACDHAGEKAAILEQLRRGRHLLGSVDALEHFRSWRTPDERLQED
jgi:hypothetical protein